MWTYILIPSTAGKSRVWWQSLRSQYWEGRGSRIPGARQSASYSFSERLSQRMRLKFIDKDIRCYPLAFTHTQMGGEKKEKWDGSQKKVFWFWPHAQCQMILGRCQEEEEALSPQYVQEEVRGQ